MVGGGIRVEVDGRGAMDELVDADDDDGKGPRNELYFNLLYRVTIPPVQNLPLTSKQKFRFGLVWPGLARLKRNFCFEVNGRF